jgi:Flp pilus assembly protein TadG
MTPNYQLSSSPRRRRREGGQSLVEFAIMAIPMLLLLMGLIDFGFLFEKQVSLTNAARAGGRYASLHPTAWSNSGSPASNTIQGQILLGGNTSSLPNDDSHISLTFYPAGSTTMCGSYSQASNSVTYYSGYTQATCLDVGNSVKIQLTNNYQLLTPLISSLYPSGVTAKALAAFLISVYP